MKHEVLFLLTLFAALGTSLADDPTPLFSEDFDDPSLANGATLTTSNTAFTAIKIVGLDVVAAVNPSFTGSGASMSLLGATSGTSSIAAVGQSTGTYSPAFDVGTLNFSLQTPTSFTGSDVVISLGNGTYYNSSSNVFGLSSSSNGYNVYTVALRIDSTGAMTSCTPSSTGTSSSTTGWTSVTTLTANTIYKFSLVFNGSASTVSYDTNSLAAGKADLWLNDVLVANDFAIRDSASVSGWAIKMNGTGQTASPWGFDNFALYNAAVAAVPEPHEYGIALAALLGGVILARRGRFVG